MQSINVQGSLVDKLCVAAGKCTGQFEDPLRTTVVDLVFGQDKGLGLQLVRYNIGGSGWSSPDIANFRFGANVPRYVLQ